MTVGLNIHCHKRERDALVQMVTAETAQGRAWLAEHREAARQVARDQKLTVQERDALLDQVALMFADRQAAGEFRDTYLLFLLPHLRAIVTEQGWSGRMPKPIPTAATLRVGRPNGTHDERFDARIHVDLPDDLGQRITRGCYWTSAPAVRALKAFREKFGDGWRGRLHDPDWIWRGSGPSRADLQDREKHAAQIITTGEVGREALRRALREGMLGSMAKALEKLG